MTTEKTNDSARERYDTARNNFDDLTLEQRTVFLLEAAMSTMARAVQDAGRQMADVLSVLFPDDLMDVGNGASEEKPEEEKSEEEKPAASSSPKSSARASSSRKTSARKSTSKTTAKPRASRSRKKTEEKSEDGSA